MACLSVWQHLWVGRQQRGVSESWKHWQGSLHHGHCPAPRSCCCSPSKFWALSKEGLAARGCFLFSGEFLQTHFHLLLMLCMLCSCMSLSGALWEAAACPAGWHREGIALLPPACDGPWWEWVPEQMRTTGFQEDKNNWDFSSQGSTTTQKVKNLCSSVVHYCGFCTKGFVQASFFLKQ